MPFLSDTPHRREHIERRHCRQKNICSRCQAAFESLEELKDHHRSTEGCPLRPEAPATTREMLDESQRQLLRKRSRKKSEFEKWNELYRMVHRLGDSDPIPSPCKLPPVLSLPLNAIPELLKAMTTRYVRVHASAQPKPRAS